MAGESSDLLGCVCVCCVCVGWWSFFTSSVSLHFLSIHCHHQLVTTLFSFLAGAVLVKKVSSFSIHPSTSHPFSSNPVGILSFSLYVLNLWTDWTLWNSRSFRFYNYWIGDCHWSSWRTSIFSFLQLLNWTGHLHWTSWGLSIFSFLQLLDWRLSLDFLGTVQLQRLFYYKFYFSIFSLHFSLHFF